MSNTFKHMYDLCKDHMHAYVLVEAADGARFDGILTGLDDEYVYFAVPNDLHDYEMMDMDESRQFYSYPAYGYPISGGYGSYGSPPARFRRIILPLSGLSAIRLLPWY